MASKDNTNLDEKYTFLTGIRYDASSSRTLPCVRALTP
jgi:hypothetical protein